MLLVAAGAAFFVLAVSRSAYEVTSPGWWPWHHVLRKLYGLGAFAVLGYLLEDLQIVQDRHMSGPAAGVFVGAYSAVIEVAQRLAGSHESQLSNVVDMAFGFIGGTLGAWLAELRVRLLA